MDSKHKVEHVHKPFATITPTKDEHVTINCNSNVKCPWAWTYLVLRPTSSALRLKPKFVI